MAFFTQTHVRDVSGGGAYLRQPRHPARFGEETPRPEKTFG